MKNYEKDAARLREFSKFDCIKTSLKFYDDSVFNVTGSLTKGFESEESTESAEENEETAEPAEESEETAESVEESEEPAESTEESDESTDQQVPAKKKKRRGHRSRKNKKTGSVQSRQEGDVSAQTSDSEGPRMSAETIEALEKSSVKEPKIIDLRARKTFSKDKLDEHYRGKHFGETRWQTLGVAGLDGCVCAQSGELHPCCLVNPISEEDYPKSWTVAIDETGNSSYIGKGAPIRVVGVFVPEGSALGAYNSHATEDDFKTNSDVIEKLLENSKEGKGCRILGVSIDSLNDVDSDKWLYAIETLLDLALRLLPLSDKETVAINVKIEHRSYKVNDSVLANFLSEQVMSRFARAYPEKAAWIKLKAEFVEKNGCDYNGYVDVIANLWGSSAFPYLRDYTGLVGTCLIDGAITGQHLRNVFDLIEREATLRPEDWLKMLESKDYGMKNSIVCSLLAKLGEQIKTIPERWNEYLDFTIRYIETPDFDESALLRQIEWLQEYAPEESARSKKIGLLVRMCEIVGKGLTGDVVDETDSASFNKANGGKEKKLGNFDSALNEAKEFRYEDATLACNAQLYLANAYKNSFNYYKMYDILENLANKRGGYSAAIFGLKTYGRVWKYKGEGNAYKKTLATRKRISMKRNHYLTNLATSRKGERKSTICLSPGLSQNLTTLQELGVTTLLKILRDALKNCLANRSSKSRENCDTRTRKKTTIVTTLL